MELRRLEQYVNGIVEISLIYVITCEIERAAFFGRPFGEEKLT
jgi:hypothetical protein